MRHQSDIFRCNAGAGNADSFADLFHSPVNDGMDIRLEKPFEIIAAYGFQRAKADRPVFLKIPEKLQKSFLSQQRALMLAQ